MNGFDLAVLAVVALSVLFAFFRGIIREVVSLAAWIAGFVLAFVFSGTLGDLLSVLKMSPVVCYVVAFALILIATLVAGGLAGGLLRKLVKAVGLGLLDRLLGGVFGLARGVLMLLAFALFVGLTALPRQEWWQNSTLGPVLAVAALHVRPWLPPAWAERLDFSGRGGGAGRKANEA